MTLKEAAKKAAEKRNLSGAEMRLVFGEIMSGGADPEEVKSFLIALADKGETADEITAAARVMREKMTKINLPYETLLDTCGTGGGSRSFNVSTVVALIAASCGVKVAKHGNRSYTSHCGSADLLERLGVNIDAPPERVVECIKRIGIGFLFAPLYHSAMKHVAAARSQIKTRTIFNILGPLANPAGANVQVIGVFDRNLVEKLAFVLKALGTRRAFVVYGLDGFDEVSVSDKTMVAEVKDDRVRTYKLCPEDFGLAKKIQLHDIACSNIADNIKAVRSVLEGERSGRRDMAFANTALALTAAGASRTLEEGVRMAKDAVDSGKTTAVLEAFVKLSNGIGI